MNNFNKLTAISLAVTAALPMMVNADVMITEYVEGSSNNKAIELYNSGDAVIDLAGYKLVRYKDGVTEPSDMQVLDGQTIAPKSTKVILNSSAVITLPQGVDSFSGTLNFNGGDAVALVKDSAVVDIIGDVPTPTGWGLDVTFKRKLDSLVANTVFNSAQWEQLPKDTFTGLGSLDTLVTPEVPAFSCSGAEIVPIYQVQGAGESSPYVPEGVFESEAEVTVRGVVTARGESLFKGFYLQEVKSDNSPYTSDGVFVFLDEVPSEAIQPGVEVCVQGKVKEYFGLTQIDIKADKKFEIGTKGTVPIATPLYVADGETLAQALERYEGMNVVLDAGSDLKISRTFSYDYAGRRNNMLVSYQAPLMKPTQLYPALSPEATALVKSNLENQLFIESDYKPANGVIPYFPDFNVETGYIRVGDQLTNLQGVIGYSYGAYRLVATNSITAGDFIRGGDRTDAPSVATKGDLRVASFNVLNFFNDVVGGDTNPSGSNRGALTEEEMLLQRAKIVSAITAMNADIVGLMEIANNGFGEKSAIKNLVDALNEKQTAENAYSFVEITDADKYEGKYFGSDAITVGMLYRGDKVTLAGAAQMIEMPEQHASAGSVTRTQNDKIETNLGNDAYQRHSLAQTFNIHGQTLTVVVNHLKSKGSGCLEDWVNFEDQTDPADQQGKCNAFRVSAAKVLGEALKDVKGDLLVIGDMNAYGMEDPIRVLTDFDASQSDRDIVTASWTTLGGRVFERQGSKIDKGYGLINLNTQAHGTGTYSYSYSGELGNLDHALANTSLAKRLVDIEDWHINSVESNLFEYSKAFSGDLAKSENAFSASDHDPVIVALSYPAPVEPSKPEAKSNNNGGALGYFGLVLLSLFGLQRRSR